MIWLTTGRMGQLGKIHVVNTKAYLEAGRYVMVEHGGYTDAEVDVLSRCLAIRVQRADSQLRLICKTCANMPCIRSTSLLLDTERY